MRYWSPLAFVVFIHFFLVTSFPAKPELYFYCSYNLQVNSNVGVVNTLIDQAASYGYTGLVLADYKLEIMQSGILPDSYYTNLQTVLSHAASKNFTVIPEIYPFGYSDGIFESLNINLAEPQPAQRASFIVSSDRTKLTFNNTYNGPVNGDFSQHNGNTFQGYGWTYQDAPGTRTFADSSVYHSSPTSLRIDGSGSTNGRVVQSKLPLGTQQQLHVSVYVKTSGFSGDVGFELLDPTDNYAINYNILDVAATQDWTKYDFVCNTAKYQTIDLYLGVWGTSKGSIWFDDVVIVYSALVNLVRRSGTPLTLYDATNGTKYTEGTDFNQIIDTIAVNQGYYDNYHTPPTVTLPSSTKLVANQHVLIDYYAVVPVYNEQVGACLTDPSIKTYMQTNIANVSAQFPSGTGYFLGYDEMRHMHTCTSCEQAASTPGELLANHVVESSSIVLTTAKNVPRLYFWGDMFDPNQNAHDNYYFVDGDISNSWNGLLKTGSQTVIMNWNLGNLVKSLNWFQGMNLSQIIAGYYDSGNGAQSASQEMSNVNQSNATEVLGWMYTTWYADYSQLQPYAATILANWPPK